VNDDALAGLPQEVIEVIKAPEQLRQEQLEALGREVAEMRDAAVKARKESGIEETWLECEEAYLGIDDENRNEHRGARWMKPMTMDAPLTQRRANSSDEVRATAFLSETARYVDIGAAKVCEITLPIDGKPFTLKATPLPEMASAADNHTPAEAITGTPMPGPDGQPVKVSDLAKHQIQRAEDAAEKAATRIYDWLVECKHPAQMRKVVFDMARIGVGILAAPEPQQRRTMVVRRTPAPPSLAQTALARATSAVTVDFVAETKPASRWVDPWCFYPAPGCGEDIHKGDHCFEVFPCLGNELLALAEQQDLGYLPEAIKRVIEEGPGKSYANATHVEKPLHREQFQRWRFTGWIDAEKFKVANPEQAADLPQSMNRVYVIGEIVNDTIIRAVLPPLDGNRLPYHVGCWRRRAGHWAGKGVAEQVRTPQRVLNSAARRMFTNAGQSSGAQVVMDPDAVQPANGDARITPDKLWFMRKGHGIDDVRKAFETFEWPNTTQQLMVIIEFALKMFEEHSSIPLVTQGQSGKTTPDTFSGQQLQDNNAQQLLRDVGFGVNDTMTTPMIDQFYEWLLLDPDVPDDEKGDYKVDTSGALAIIEKALQDQTLLAMGSMLANPEFRINPAKWFEEWARSKRLVPSNFQYTEAEWAEKMKQPPPEDPRITAAKIGAESREKVAQSHDQLARERNAKDVDRDAEYNRIMATREETMRASAIEDLKLRREIALLEYARDMKVTLEEAKTKLADTTIKVKAQMDLAGADGKGPQVATPPDEPPGRAADGTAYQA
jgi:hypothetical protein